MPHSIGLEVSNTVLQVERRLQRVLLHGWCHDGLKTCVMLCWENCFQLGGYDPSLCKLRASACLLQSGSLGIPFNLSRQVSCAGPINGTLCLTPQPPLFAHVLGIWAYMLGRSILMRLRTEVKDPWTLGMDLSMLLLRRTD